MITIENVQYKLDNELVEVETLSDGELQTAIQQQVNKLEVMDGQEKDLRILILDLRESLLKAELAHAKKKNAIIHNGLIKTRLEAERAIRVMLDEKKRKKRRRIPLNK